MAAITPFNYEDRVATIQSWLPEDVELEIEAFCYARGPIAYTEERKIKFPCQMLLLPQDFPDHLKITDVQDPRLYEPQFLQNFQEHCKTLHPCFNVDLQDNNCRSFWTRVQLLLMHKPEKYTKAIRFVVGHETQHVIRYWTCGHGVTAWCRDRMDDVGDAMRSAARRIFGENCPIAPHASSSRKATEESACDIGAAQAVGDATGGIHFFEMAMILGDDRGNGRLRHYPPAKRVQDLTKLQDDYNDPVPAALEFPEKLLEELRVRDFPAELFTPLRSPV